MCRHFLRLANNNNVYIIYRLNAVEFSYISSNIFIFSVATSMVSVLDDMCGGVVGICYPRHLKYFIIKCRCFL